MRRRHPLTRRLGSASPSSSPPASRRRPSPAAAAAAGRPARLRRPSRRPPAEPSTRAAAAALFAMPAVAAETRAALSGLPEGDLAAAAAALDALVARHPGVGAA